MSSNYIANFELTNRTVNRVIQIILHTMNDTKHRIAIFAQNVWNCYEFAVLNRMAPSITIGNRRIIGRKEEKTRVTSLVSVNSNGTEKFPPRH